MQIEDEPGVLFEMSNNIATLTLNRPEKKNAMDLVMRRDLADIVSSIRQDRGIQALIITGAL